MRYRVHLIVCTLSAALLVSCANGMGSSGGMNEPLRIQFSGTGLQPETARIPADGNVTWVNQALEYRGIVVLPASMGASFTCSDLRPTFERVSAGYQSLAITQEDPENVTLPCALRPGTYPYELWLFGQGLGELSDDAVPARKLRGTLVVESVGGSS